MRNNSVLKSITEVQQASEQLKSLGLFAHHDWIKSWDTYKMVDIIIRTCKKIHSCLILDVMVPISYQCLRDQVFARIIKVKMWRTNVHNFCLCCFCELPYEAFWQLYFGF